MTAFKLLRRRADGSLGPLFINATLRVPIGEWLDAEDHPTKGYKHRPGWHCTARREAPHLSEKGRVWCNVVVDDFEMFNRPVSQGGQWILAQRMKVLGIIG